MEFLDLFSGIGGFRLGLERAGHECVGYVEWDKYARKSYEAIHNTEGEWTRHDITEISNEEWSELKDSVDIVVGGSPCQAFSIAGNRLGFEDTRGTMFFYYANAIKQTQPDYFMFENVKGLLSHDKGNTIKTILSTFDEIGYAVDFDVFNSKYYGVPQNRERIFIVGKRKDLVDDTLQIPPVGKKTLDKIKQWASENVQLISLLPNNTDLEVTTRLRDILEPIVDKKFYLSDEQTAKLVFNMENQTKDSDQIKVLAHRDGYRRNTQVFDQDGLTETLDTGAGGGRGHYTMEGSEPRIIIMGNTNPSGRGMNGQVYSSEGLSPTVSTNKGEGNKISEPVIGASRGRNPNNPSDRTTGSPTEQRLEINQDGVNNTLTTVQKDNYVVEGLPIREATKQGYSVAKDGDSVNIQYPTSTTRRGRVGNQIANTIQAGEANQGVVEAEIVGEKEIIAEVTRIARKTRPSGEIGVSIHANGDIRAHRMDAKKSGISELAVNHFDNIANTVTAAHMPKIYGGSVFRIRKLTPLECFRLQAFPDSAYYAAEKVNSNSQLYKQAGNSVTVNVIEAIAKRLE